MFPFAIQYFIRIRSVIRNTFVSFIPNFPGLGYKKY